MSSLWLCVAISRRLRAEPLNSRNPLNQLNPKPCTLRTGNGENGLRSSSHQGEEKTAARVAAAAEGAGALVVWDSWVVGLRGSSFRDSGFRV